MTTANTPFLSLQVQLLLLQRQQQQLKTQYQIQQQQKAILLSKKPIQDWSQNDTQEWLKAIGMFEHLNKFSDFNGNRLLQLDAMELQKMGIQSLPHRQFIMEKLKQHLVYQQTHSWLTHLLHFLVQFLSSFCNYFSVIIFRLSILSIACLPNWQRIANGGDNPPKISPKLTQTAPYNLVFSFLN